LVNAYQIKTIEVEKHQIRYYDNLNSSLNLPPLLLLHGLGGSADRWKEVIPYLSGKYRLIIPDIIGF
jgi:pimeloyl-ACP methyl ester carboxylesterase